MIYQNPAKSISRGNSTTTPLASGATFTGDWEITPEPNLMCTCITDNTGTLYFDFSPDGVNADSTFPVNGFAITSGVHEFHTAVKGPRYFRVRLVNDTGAQTYLRLTTYYGDFEQGNLPLNQTIAADADARVVRSVGAGLDLAFGRFAGMSENNKFGYSADLGSSIILGTPSTWETLWAYGGLRTFQSSTFTPYIASSAAGDTSIDVTVFYLDSDGVEQTVEVTTNASDGRTSVSLGVTAQDISRAYLSDNVSLAGNLTITTADNFTAGVADDQTEVQSFIAANDNQTQQLAARVPSNKRRHLKFKRFAMLRDTGAAGSVIMALMIREPNGAWRNREPIFLTTSVADTGPMTGFVLPPLTDYYVQIRDVSDASTFVKGRIDHEDIDV